MTYPIIFREKLKKINRFVFTLLFRQINFMQYVLTYWFYVRVKINNKN